jgi:hypothetical protein
MLTMEATLPRAKNGYLSIFAQAADEILRNDCRLLSLAVPTLLNAALAAVVGNLQNNL